MYPPFTAFCPPLNIILTVSLQCKKNVSRRFLKNKKILKFNKYEKGNFNFLRNVGFNASNFRFSKRK